MSQISLDLRMKILHCNSILSCILKCIRIVISMMNKKIVFGLIFLVTTGACTSPTALLGPAYTLTSSGNIYHAGFSYSSNELITKYTGKTPIENLKEITTKQQEEKNNIQKKTLQSEDFYNLVKNKIEETGSLLKNSTQ